MDFRAQVPATLTCALLTNALSLLLYANLLYYPIIDAFDS